MLKIQKAIAITLILNCVLLVAVPASADNRDRELKVMTYNMYLGSELSEIFAAETPTDVLLEVGEAYRDMLSGDVPARIAAIADQIEDGAPVLVGLQEVALWRTGPAFDPTLSTSIRYDFLQMLLGELDARNLHYSPIVIQTNIDAELPGIITPELLLDIRYTDRMVILARYDLPESEFKLEETDAGHFADNVQVTIFGETKTVWRGWTSADVKFRGKPYRFVNAHLESFDNEVQQDQAEELAQLTESFDSALILVGDFNSDAQAGGVSYGILIDSGLCDVWSATNSTNPGFTWALSGEIPSNVMTPTQRLDLILARGPVHFSGSDVVGEELSDMTADGYRPSDHAGVVASVVLEP